MIEDLSADSRWAETDGKLINWNKNKWSCSKSSGGGREHLYEISRRSIWQRSFKTVHVDLVVDTEGQCEGEQWHHGYLSKCCDDPSGGPGRYEPRPTLSSNTWHLICPRFAPKRKYSLVKAARIDYISSNLMSSLLLPVCLPHRSKTI